MNDNDFVIIKYTDSEIDVVITELKRLLDKPKLSITGNILLHDTDEKVGFISMDFSKLDNPELGNIVYEIKKEHRGHGYTLKALNLLREFMLEREMKKPILHIYPSNVYSTNIALNFGGNLIASPTTHNQRHNTYEVDLEKVLKKQKDYNV